MGTKKKIDLLTMRQYMFLKWLKLREQGNLCDITNTDITCFNCLEKQSFCTQGVIPASYFSKKTSRQYFDTKRVLDSLVKMQLVEELEIHARDYHRYYKIASRGITHLKNYEAYFWLYDKSKNEKKPNSP